MEDVTVKLRTPIKDGEEMITELSFREPRVRDQLNADLATNNDGDAEVVLFSSLANCSPNVIKDMSLYDQQQVRRAVGSFLGSSPESSSGQ